ncbi:MAG TPA: outer membrane protein assembly factor BamE [Sphingomicrobium sp.]|nr:outer membrane protein assembly factor BamE [Sphingomicrobium sp.]
MKVLMAKAAITLLAAGLLAGCAGVREHRGAVIDDELLSAIQVGVDNKESVQTTLGRPTFAGEFGANDWYYVSRNTKQVAFRQPRVMKQTVLHIRFDQAGNVASVETTGKELIAKIDPVDDQTETLGRKPSLLEDIFGNIGTVGAGVAPQQ